MSMYYYIKTGPKYWKPRGCGYTKNRAEAGVFTLKDMEAFNLDGCTLERAEVAQGCAATRKCAVPDYRL
ncbi:hypothetical protein ACGLYR_004591 [Escherichia coli]